mgnify:FL=1|jgi:DNA helicase-2/ATP-dependent DNA helicase PcrA
MVRKEWSELQKNIFDTYENSRSNIFVKATAGGSKTTVMVECAKRTSPMRRSIFMAFNKSIAEELKAKVPEHFETSTFHSKGFKILLKNFNFKPKISENKTFSIGIKILKIEDEIPANQRQKYLFNLQEIWNQIRVNLFDDYESSIPMICLEKEIEFKERMIQDIIDIEKEWMKNAKKISSGGEFVLDFTDMLYLVYKLIDPLNLPKYDVLFLDEGQDLNVLQREFALRLLKPRGRFMIVGDFSQAIYAFQGASVDNFSYFQNLPNTTTLPLSVTYRCAKNIVKEAQKVFPNDIQFSPNAIDGVVREGKLLEAESGDFVLCRNNIPLVEAFLKFLEAKKKATIKGKDLGEALQSLLGKITNITELDDLLDEKLKKLMEKGITRAAAVNNPSYIALEEKCKILHILYNRFLGSIEELKSTVNEIFVEDVKGIVLCTCHKSKGLEADRVFFLNQDLIPSEHAKTERALYAERCLRFVAITRARKELIYCYI